MGLDIYLEKCGDLETALRIEKEYSEQSEKFWDFAGRKYEKLTDDEKESARQKSDALRLKMGLVDYGTHPSRVQFKDKKSAKHPNHLFEIGYLRSSYNPGGINNTLRRLGLMDLYEIFNAADEYIVRPDWEASRQRAELTLTKLRKQDGFDVMKVAANMFTPAEQLPQDEKSARDLFIKQWNRKKEVAGGFDSYGNRDGKFFLNGVQCFAFIPGRGSAAFDEAGCTYVILEQEFDFYVQALEIVIEMCDFVLSQPDAKDFYLRWSS